MKLSEKFLLKVRTGGKPITPDEINRYGEICHIEGQLIMAESATDTYSRSVEDKTYWEGKCKQLNNRLVQIKQLNKII